MAGGAPVPVPTSDPDEKILSIADLEKEASKKLGKSARGNTQSFVMLNFLAIPMILSFLVFCLGLNEDIEDPSLQSITQRKILKNSHILYDECSFRCSFVERLRS